MGFARVGSTGGGTATAAASFAISYTPTAGNHLFVGFGLHTSGATISTIADNQSNTWARAISTAGGTHADSWHAFGVAGAATTITVTLAASGGYCFTLVEFSSSGAVSLDGTSPGTGASGTALTSGNTAATAQANEVAFGVAVYNATTAPPFSGQAFSPAVTGQTDETYQLCTASSNHVAVQVSDGITGAAGNAESFSATSAGSVAWACLCVTYQEAPGGAVVTDGWGYVVI